MFILAIIAIGFLIGYFQDAESYLDYLKPLIVLILLVIVYLFVIKPHLKAKSIEEEQIKLDKETEQKQLKRQSEIKITQSIIQYFKENEVDLTKYDKSLAFSSDNSTSSNLIYCEYCRFNVKGNLEINDHESEIILTNTDVLTYETLIPYDVLLRVKSSSIKFEDIELEVENYDDYSYLELEMPIVTYRARLLRIMPTYSTFISQNSDDTYNYYLDEDKIKDDVIKVLGSQYLPFFE